MIAFNLCDTNDNFQKVTFSCLSIHFFGRLLEKLFISFLKHANEKFPYSWSTGSVDSTKSLDGQTVSIINNNRLVPVIGVITKGLKNKVSFMKNI